MFKMGCSMARKILAIDNKNEQQRSPSGSSKKSKDKSTQEAAGSGGGLKAATGDELGDFSKLEQDPRIPLNVRQIFKITKSWKAIARTMSRTGTAMFLNLFEQNQDLFYLFDRFQHLKGTELHESMELREHAATVMSTLDQSINSLSDYDNFVTYLHSIGKLHHKVPGFKRSHFWKIEQPFMKAVKQTLDERCNETIEEIYKIAIKLIIETIADGYGDGSDDDDGAKEAGGGDNGGRAASGNDNASGGGPKSANNNPALANNNTENTSRGTSSNAASINGAARVAAGVSIQMECKGSYNETSRFQNGPKNKATQATDCTKWRTGPPKTSIDQLGPSGRCANTAAAFAAGQGELDDPIRAASSHARQQKKTQHSTARQLQLEATLQAFKGLLSAATSQQQRQAKLERETKDKKQRRQKSSDVHCELHNSSSNSIAIPSSGPVGDQLEFLVDSAMPQRPIESDQVKASPARASIVDRNWQEDRNRCKATPSFDSELHTKKIRSHFSATQGSSIDVEETRELESSEINAPKLESTRRGPSVGCEQAVDEANQRPALNIICPFAVSRANPSAGSTTASGPSGGEQIAAGGGDDDDDTHSPEQRHAGEQTIQVSGMATILSSPAAVEASSLRRLVDAPTKRPRQQGEPGGGCPRAWVQYSSDFIAKLAPKGSEQRVVGQHPHQARLKAGANANLSARPSHMGRKLEVDEANTQAHGTPDGPIITVGKHINPGYKKQHSNRANSISTATTEANEELRPVARYNNVDERVKEDQSGPLGALLSLDSAALMEFIEMLRLTSTARRVSTQTSNHSTTCEFESELLTALA